MVERVRIDFGRAHGECLVLLYSRFVKDVSGLSTTDIAARLKLPRNVVRMVVRGEIRVGRCREDYRGTEVKPVGIGASLAALGSQTFAFSGYDETKVYIEPDMRTIEITQAGIEWVNDLSDAKYTSFLGGVGGDIRAVSQIPASDRTVTLNHNQPDYQETVAALDKVIEEFRNDHRLDNECGPEKDAYLKFLEGGRRLLDDNEIAVSAGENWIVRPLKWVIEKFGEGVLQVAATKALELICKLLERLGD